MSSVISRPLVTEPATASRRYLDKSAVWTLANVWMPRLALPLALVVGAFLRLWSVNSVGFNSDEAVYAGQAAALANDPELSRFFPIVRAHPMLFQTMLGFVFRISVDDGLARLVSVAFGLATIVVVYKTGALLYGQRAGAIAAMIMAIMPYHVVVTRQVLLDGPMTFFATLTLYLLVMFAIYQRPAALYATGAAIGLVFLSKETGFVLFLSIYAFLTLTPTIRLRIRDIVIALAVMMLTIASFPISVTLAGRAETAQSYIVWQIFRRPNHTWGFYPEVVPPSIGPLVLITAGLGLIVMWRQRTWRERLLIGWIIVPCAMFELWPVKGFQYLLPTAPAIAMLAARTITAWSPRLPSRAPGWLGRSGTPLRLAAVAAVFLSLIIPVWGQVQPSTSSEFLAGSGGIPGGRETGTWIRENIPQDALFLTVGPSMANLIQYYGHRKAYGLSVSPNPLHRNPSYEAITNPDSRIRNSELQYLVYDSFSAGRSPFFAEKLLKYAKTYHGRIIHQETVTVIGPDGVVTEKPVIVIYEVRGDV